MTGVLAPEIEIVQIFGAVACLDSGGSGAAPTAVFETRPKGQETSRYTNKDRWQGETTENLVLIKEQNKWKHNYIFRNLEEIITVQSENIIVNKLINSDGQDMSSTNKI